MSSDDGAVTKQKLAEAATRIRSAIGPWTTLEILVAADTDSFNDTPRHLGHYGHRGAGIDRKRARV